ncbi:hypothetical protein NEOLEDRAFT_1174892 [Neolentinus lepideus HHB14362 ss-1]|uniref:C2H2-type domain-containing protein n=1 Tax=Neolentinus lepideus HHB14362 ss-1 TaxID=1314782 RepID=A0A165VMY6_9AGAM|nr:hypothetical protein NEOLEDRAFT_1174892 [Neolentinus lepideus HHB14362 ss-1]
MSPDHQSICILCNQNFATYEALDAHFQSSTNHPNCDRCLKGFASEAILRVHKICSHPAEICPQCPQLGPIYKEDLPEHYMQVEKHPKCKSCNLAFENDTVYEQHRSTEHDPSVDDEKVHETVINLACTDTVNERDWQSPDSQDLFLSCLQKAKTTANSVDVNESPAALSIRDTARQHVLSTYLTQTPQEGIVNIPMPCGEGKLIQLEIKVVDTIDAIAADKGCGKESSMAEDDATSLSAVVDSAARASVGVANPPDEGGPTARHVDGRREEVILDLDYNPWVSKPVVRC